jgi:hypothetical protein
VERAVTFGAHGVSGRELVFGLPSERRRPCDPCTSCRRPRWRVSSALMFSEDRFVTGDEESETHAGSAFLDRLLSLYSLGERARSGSTRLGSFWGFGHGSSGATDPR